MMSAPPAARRLSLFGCGLMAAAALLMPGCGGGTGATAEGPTTQSEPRAQAAKTAAEPCPAKVHALVDSLDRLRRQLAIGLSYEQYAAEIKALQASYARIPVEKLTFNCLAKTGTPAEQALNGYIDAANAWGECLAAAACTTAAIEPVLQRKWRLAAGPLSAAE